MAISHFFDKSVVIRRLSTVSGNRKTWVATMTIDMHIQSASDSDDLEYYAAYSASHKAWVDVDFDVHEGDQVVDSDGFHYEVTNILQKDYSFAMNVHQEVFMRLNNDN